MAVTAKVRVKGTNLTLKPTLEKAIEAHYNQPSIQMVCLLDARVEVTGTVTGNLYIFTGGTPVDVDIQDKDELLNKKRKNACCGGNSNASIFVLA